MIGRFAIACLVWAWVCVPAFAATVELSAKTVDLEEGQTVWLQVEVVDGQPTAVPAVDAPEGVSIRFSHPVSQFETSWSGLVRTERFLYQLTGETAGTYTLGPVRVPLVKGEQQTNRLTFTVRARPAASADQLQAFAGFEPDKAWEGQVVVFRWGVRTRLPTYRVSWSRANIEGLVPPRDSRVDSREYEIVDPEGSIHVQESLQPLIATGVGVREVPASVVRVEVAKRTRTTILGPRITATEPHTVRTAPTRLEVLRRPPPPPGFSGLVGDFTFTSSVSTERAKVGQSVEWVVRVLGDGALEGFAFDRMGDLKGARVYDGSPKLGAKVISDGTWRAEGLYARVIVPTRTGRLKLPDLEVVTFSPGKGAYVTHKIDVPAIEVVPGGETEVAVQSFGEDELMEEEDLGLREVWVSGAAHALWLGPAAPWMLVVAGAPAVGFVGLRGLLWGSAVARRRLERRARPMTPLERLNALPADPEARLAEIDGLLRQAVAARVRVPVGTLDLTTDLADVDPHLVDEIEQIVAALHQVRFAERDRPLTDLVARVRRVVIRLEEV